MPSKPALAMTYTELSSSTLLCRGFSCATVPLDFVLHPQALHLNFLLQPRSVAPSFTSTDCRKSKRLVSSSMKLPRPLLIELSSLDVLLHLHYYYSFPAFIFFLAATPHPRLLGFSGFNSVSQSCWSLQLAITSVGSTF